MEHSSSFVSTQYVDGLVETLVSIDCETPYETQFHK